MRLQVYLMERVRPRALAIAGTGALAAGLGAILGPAPEAPAAGSVAEASVARLATDAPPVVSAVTLTAAVDDGAEGSRPEMPAFSAALAESLETQSPEALAQRIEGLTQAVDRLPRDGAGPTPAAVQDSAEIGLMAPTDG